MRSEKISFERRIPFCHNSRRWLIFLNPRSCPYGKESCPIVCGYYEERMPNKYIKRKMKMLYSYARIKGK